MGTFSHPIPRLENKLQTFPKLFLDLRMKWEHFPFKSCCSVRELSLQCKTDSWSPITSRPHRACIYSAVTAFKKRPYWELWSPFFCITCLSLKSGLAKTVSIITKTTYWHHCLTVTVVNMIEYTNNLFSIVLLTIMLPKIYQTMGNRYQLSLLMTVVTVNPRGPLLEPAVHQKLKLLPH